LNRDEIVEVCIGWAVVTVLYLRQSSLYWMRWWFIVPISIALHQTVRTRISEYKIGPIDGRLWKL